jgi:hypothetical protein
MKSPKNSVATLPIQTILIKLYKLASGDAALITLVSCGQQSDFDAACHGWIVKVVDRSVGRSVGRLFCLWI